MNATTAISEPQRGHDNRSTSCTRLISMAQVFVQPVGAAANVENVSAKPATVAKGVRWETGSREVGSHIRNARSPPPGLDSLTALRAQEYPS